jgi:hypothetical protein
VRRLVIAFALGAAAVGVIAVVLALLAAMLAEASDRNELHVALGPIALLDFQRDAAGSSTTFGPGLIVLPLLGGLLNAAGAALLRNRD